MSIIKSASSIPRAAVIYVTVGALTLVWSGIWYVYALNNPGNGETTLYWCYGFLLTGLMLVLIGLAIGWIGRTRRSTHRAAPADQTAANGAISAAVSPAATPATMAISERGS